MIDLIYLAVGSAGLLVFWAFAKACDELVETKHAQHHCRIYLGKNEIEKWNVALPF